MRLSTVIGVGIAALALLTTVSVASLLFGQWYLARTVESLDSNLHSVRVAQGLALGILEHARTGNRYLITGDESFRRERDAYERKILEDLREARLHVRTEEDSALLDIIERETARYLAARREAAAAGDFEQTSEVFRELDELLNDLDTSLRLIVDLNLAEADQARDDARRMRQLVQNIALLLLAGNLLLAGIVAVFSKRVLFGPLRRTRELAKRLAEGGSDFPRTRPALREIREIEEALREAAVKLEDQRERELGFVAGVAHDLRNPLSALRLATATLRPDRPLPDETKLRALMALVERQIGRLDRLVGDLLDAAQIQSGRLELKKEPRSVADIAREVVELFRESSRRDIAFSGEGCVAPIDPVRINQVVTNLVSNALKYSPESAPIQVAVRCDPNEVTVEVQDRGVGIPADELPHIFEPFRRTRSSRESVPGVGLGLSVSRKIAEAHGGRLEVESRAGEGSTFTLHLPAS